ncbi:putative Bacterial Ig-like domain [Xenorhabdus thuongxuanensis]|uniref:Putative Bacterial Ig-like domain n=3 Tax=Xenorhabdus thuongxuanensis TaxID=1873484 RepID=A0A1Q5U2I6_9GAMM|nr:putative Bacterial Ig-like domain [Xenorhabdus thuongxuanensis]
MLSYIGKVIFLLFFLYTLLVPYTITNSFAEGWLKTERATKKADENDNISGRVNESDKKYLNSDTHKKSSVKENNHTSDADTQNVITKNLQMAGNFLSSSPSELAEQAKSYALGQVNGMVTSEAQKWLSQFGTARINFGLDKKGSRKNSSLDLLLPLYDNKADWLFFSQLGYRNKDSRDTINVGLGGRYFYQDWMYGLNTFYDNDLTGKNQRLGLGGEVWADNIKLAANTYFRVSNWKNSRDFVGYYERPANGYDISGEFFLPAYPNLGAKLTYEQYFGDEVTLFDRDTKQKNPVLATLGLSYTPVPLFTLGVDYKQGNGHNETQFLANLSYRLGVPLSVQLSPENVAIARTLAGSRYDLVERNNHIVLEHQAKPAAQLSLPEVITGYSGSQQDITAKFSSESPLKQIHWATNKDFEQHGGKLSSKTGNTINVTLPTYLSGNNQNNNYPIYAVAEWENNQKSAPAEMRVIVRPFMLKKQEGANFTPAGPLPATGDQKDGYTFDPVITFDTAANAPIKNVTINHVQWITDPKIGPESGLKLLDWGTSDSVVLDENGRFKQKPVLVSQHPHKDVKVYLQIDSQPPELVGEVSFGDNPANSKDYSIGQAGITSEKLQALSAGGYQQYQFMATILGADGNPVKEGTVISDAHWKIDKPSDATKSGITLTPETKTDDKGNLKAIITSTKAFSGDVVVSLSIEGQAAVSAQTKVTFTKDTQDYSVSQAGITPEKLQALSAGGYQQYQFMATILGADGNPVKEGTVISDAHWKIDKPSDATKSGITLTPETKTDDKGNLKAIITSTKAFSGDVVVSLSIEGQAAVSAQTKVTFTKDTQDYSVSQAGITPEKLQALSAGGYQQYQFMATILGADGNPVKEGTVISDAHWKIDKPSDATKSGITLTPETKTDDKGNLKAIITSTKAFSGDVVVSLKVGKNKPVQSPTSTVDFKLAGISPITPDSKDPIIVGLSYNLAVIVKDDEGNPLPNKTVNWHIQASHDNKTVKIPTSSKTALNDGKATAILTSSTNQDVTVTASVDGIGATPPLQVRFVWPTLSEPEPIAQSPQSGPVYANEGGYYIYQTIISGPDGKPYQNPSKGSPGYVPIQWWQKDHEDPQTTYVSYQEQDEGSQANSPGKATVKVSGIGNNLTVVPCVGIYVPNAGGFKNLPSHQCVTQQNIRKLE